MSTGPRRLALLVTGVVLLVGGGYAVDAGLDGLGTCGATTLTASEVPDENVESPESYVAFENLTAGQRELARAAIAGESPAVTGEGWPWSETALSLEYRGEYYRLVTVTTECPVPPEAIVVGGVLGMLVGGSGLGVAVRGRSEG